MAPMFIDNTWRKLSRRDKLLCASCVFGRAQAGGIALAVADLLPCAFNLFHTPQSWFDLFLRQERRTPPNLVEWKAAATVAGIELGVGPRPSIAAWLEEMEALRVAGQMSFDEWAPGWNEPPRRR